MSNTVFSVALDALHMAKVEELMNKYPKLSRNAVIKKVITAAHAGETAHIEHLLEYIEQQQAYINKYQKKYGVLP
jgi:gamma-glutamyltranspeptidase